MRGNQRAVGVLNFLEVSCYLWARAMTGFGEEETVGSSSPCPHFLLFHGLWGGSFSSSSSSFLFFPDVFFIYNIFFSQVPLQ